MKRRLFLCFALLLSLTCVARATTLAASDILSRARTYLKDQSTSANRQQFTDATLLQFLSDGMREANAQNWILQSSTTFNLTQGTTEYALPADFMAVLRIWFRPTGGSFTKLTATSMDELDAQSAGWFNATGTPTRYYLDRTSSTVNLAFYPAPSVANSTGSVIVYYVQQTADITTTTGVPFNSWNLMQPYDSSLAYYVTYRGYLTLEETELSEKYLNYWLTFLQIMRQGLYKTPDFTPGFVGQRGP